MDDFRPDSRFGVPLTALPPGMPWHRITDVLEAALGEMRNTSSRRWLLDDDAPNDVAAIADPGVNCRALPVVLEARSVEARSAGFEAGVRNLRVNWPVTSDGQRGFGVAVSTSGGYGAHHVIFAHMWQYHRYVAHAARAEQLKVAFHQANVVECAYQRHMPDGRWVYVILHFNRRLFLDAFHIQPDFTKLRLALLQSTIGGVHHRAPPALTCGHYPFAVAENNGSHLFSSVVTTYVDGEPVLAFPIFAEGRWSFDCDAPSRKSIQHWGVFSRLQRMNAVPKVMPLSDERDVHQKPAPAPTAAPAPSVDLDSIIDCAKAADPANGSAPSNNAQPATLRRFVPIAPTHTHVASRSKALSPEEIRDEERRQRTERRKIRMRESAARYNERKSKELRERRRLEKLGLNPPD